MEDQYKKYEELKDGASKFYRGIGKVFSPALNQEIYFTSEGFNHIVFKNSRSERERNSQILRFKLLPLAVKLIEPSTTYQEFEEMIKEFEVKSFKKKVIKNKSIKYWGIIAIMNDRKIKVIVRKIGDNGVMHFWSLVPAWITNKHRDIRFFTTMKGNPGED